jgi:hypothetical protein
MGIERAKIYELDVKDNKTDVDSGIDVCFNPKEYSIDKSLTWEASKAHEDAPMPEFKSPKAMELSVTLQFDTYEERVSVRDKYVRRLEKLTMMKSKAKDEKDVKKHAPPVIRFVWGKLNFKGVISSFGQKYTMFLADGTPVRAECAIKITNVIDTAIDDGQTYTTNRAPTRTHPVTAGERIDTIANDELGDASRWVEIAQLSGLDDPGGIKEGDVLIIPGE